MTETFEKFLPRHHWSKAMFKANGIPLSAVAKALGLSYPYVCSLLSGVVKVTPEVETKLKRLTLNLTAPKEGE